MVKGQTQLDPVPQEYINISVGRGSSSNIVFSLWNGVLKISH